ncbi:unnamed protein product, partial [Rotaria magnacalcarata]
MTCFAPNPASGSGPSITYSVDTSGAVPVGSPSQNNPT